MEQKIIYAFAIKFILPIIKKKADTYQRLYIHSVQKDLPDNIISRLFNRADVLYELIEELQEGIEDD